MKSNKLRNLDFGLDLIPLPLLIREHLEIPRIPNPFLPVLAAIVVIAVLINSGRTLAPRGPLPRSLHLLLPPLEAAAPHVPRPRRRRRAPRRRPAPARPGRRHIRHVSAAVDPLVVFVHLEPRSVASLHIRESALGL